MAATEVRGTASANEQNERRPVWFGTMGDAMISYVEAGVPVTPDMRKVYPFFVPEASWVSIKQALLELGGLHAVPPRATRVLAKPTSGYEEIYEI